MHETHNGGGGVWNPKQHPTVSVGEGESQASNSVQCTAPNIQRTRTRTRTARMGCPMRVYIVRVLTQVPLRMSVPQFAVVSLKDGGERAVLLDNLQFASRPVHEQNYTSHQQPFNLSLW